MAKRKVVKKDLNTVVLNGVGAVVAGLLVLSILSPTAAGFGQILAYAIFHLLGYV